jgi:hypothetical protein
MTTGFAQQTETDSFRPSNHDLPAAALLDVVAATRPVSLDEVLVVADLQTRLDRKYLLSPEQFRKMSQHLRERFRVLEVGERRFFGYESIYFDTPSRDLYRWHRQGRRRRYKVRSRTYVDSRECLFEVKLKGRRDVTDKRRMPYTWEDRGVINHDATAFLSELLQHAYNCDAPPLERSLTITYSRSTFVDLEAGARLTCDVDMSFWNGQDRATGPDSILVESKSATPSAAVDHLLTQMGVRPLRISKYCAGTALIHPWLPANPWSRTLRREFGWERVEPN